MACHDGCVARQPLELHDLIHKIVQGVLLDTCIGALQGMICYKGGYGKHKGGITIVFAVFDKFLAVAANFSMGEFEYLPVFE